MTQLGKLSVLCTCSVVLIMALSVSCQYKDSEGRTMSQAELARLMRTSSKLGADFSASGGSARGFGASRNLYNRHQPLQYAPSYNKRSSSNYGPTDGLAGYGFNPAGPSSRSNSDDDDDDGSAPMNFNANSFDSNDDGGRNADADGESQPLNLNQAASGYPLQGDYNENSNDNAGFGPAGFDGSEFGPSEEMGGSGRLRQAGSSSAGLRNQFGANNDDDAGIPAYNPGPNSAVNSEGDDDSRASPQEGGDDDD